MKNDINWDLKSTPKEEIMSLFLCFNHMTVMEFYPSRIVDIEESNSRKLSSNLGILSIFGEVFLW